MPWTFNAAHGLSSTPTAVVVVDPTDTSFSANGTPKDLIGGEDMAIDAGVTVETGGAWGLGFETKQDGSFQFLGLRWTVGPACGWAFSTVGGTVVFFVNEAITVGGGDQVCRFSGNDSILFDSTGPLAIDTGQTPFVANTAWPLDGTAFCHAIAFHGNNVAKALFGLEASADLSADGLEDPTDNVGDDHTMIELGGFSGGGNVSANYFQVIVFDEIVSDADLQAIFDNPLIFVDQGSPTIAGQATLGFTDSAQLRHLAPIAGTATLSFAGTGNMVTGQITGDAAVDFTATGTMQAQGALAGTAAIAFTPTATFGAPGALAGSATFGFFAEADPFEGQDRGTLTGLGALAGVANLAFVGSGVFVPNAIGGATTLEFTTAAAIQAKGQLAGSAALDFSVDADLINRNAIATASFGFTASASLVAKGRLAGVARLSFVAEADTGGRHRRRRRWPTRTHVGLFG